MQFDPSLDDWQNAIDPRLTSDNLEFIDLPKVVSLPVAERKIKTESYFFSVPALKNADTNKRAVVKPLTSRTPSKKKPTRIPPPKDVVKLADKMFYLLQPPLETLLDSDTMELPFEPFDFQYFGVAFLFPRHHAILADEMGLGKTMQAITTMRMLIRSGMLRNILLICPKPLVTNWQREFDLWAPEIPVSILSGGQAKREWQWAKDTTAVKIANYELIVRDKEIVTEIQEPFDLVVIDEAQRIKNPDSTTSKTIKKINRRRSWALTGTPIENSIDDLYGIFDFVAPGSISPSMSFRELKNELSEYVLRRTKEMVIDDMPPKLIRDTELSLSAEQAAHYEQAENEGVIHLSDMGDKITVSHVFELVLRLKQICNFDPVTGASSKLELLESEMEEVAASGQKAIVFSQWVKTLDKISDRLERFNPLSYHGKIPSAKRDKILDQFKNDAACHVILMSYGAGAVGLNLQFCRYVYLFDRWWNPAVEDQAINRAHRIGAAGSVTVTRMIMAGTIEQRIHQILESKRELFEEVLSDQPSPMSRGLTREEIFGLFKLRTPSGTISPCDVSKVA